MVIEGTKMALVEEKIDVVDAVGGLAEETGIEARGAWF